MSRVWKLLKMCLLIILISTTISLRKEESFGIDVSHHNGKINWNEVAKYERPLFVYVKATEGATYIDPSYSNNMKGATKEGLKVGCYHYFRMTSSAHKQFQNFSKALAMHHQDLIPMIDVETLDKKTPKQVRDSVYVFITLIKEKFGITPMIYGTNKSYNQICAPYFNNYHLYLGRYGKNKPIIKGKGHYTIWQFTENGIVKGIPKNVDKAIFHPDYGLENILWVRDGMAK